MSLLTRETQPRSGNIHKSVQDLIFDRLRDFSLTVRTMLDATTFLTTVLPPSIRSDVVVVHDETYRHMPDVGEQRHFIICSSQQTYSHLLTDLRSKGLLVTPQVKATYWANLVEKLEKGEVFKESPSLTCVPRELELVPARPPRRVIYGMVQVDVVEMIMRMFPQFSPTPSTNANNTLGLVGIPAPTLNDSLGPTGLPTCLSVILSHDQPWTVRAAHRAYKLASQEVKSLTSAFRVKHRALVDRCHNDPMVNLTKESADALIDGIRDRREKKKMMCRIIRERRQFTKDGLAMLDEYRAQMAHFCRLQKACTAAASEAYDVDIVFVKGNLYPMEPHSS